MSLSIFNSSSEVKIFISVVTCLLVAEGLLRNFGTVVSDDLRAIARIHRTSQDFEATGRAKLKICILGNSLTQLGVVQDRVANGLGDRSIVRFACLNGAMIREWEIISRELLTHGEIDLLIVNARARHFEDSTELRLGRASLELGSLKGLIESLGQMRNRSEQVELCSGYFSRVFAWKSNVGRRVLEVIIPRYEVGERWVNQQDLSSSPPADKVPRATYDALTRLATCASDRGIQVVVCFFPTREDYSIGEVFAVMEKQRLIQVLDLRDVGLDATDFQDSTHLNSIGRNRFTRIYLQRLQGIVEKR